MHPFFILTLGPKGAPLIFLSLFAFSWPPWAHLNIAWSVTIKSHFWTAVLNVCFTKPPHALTVRTFKHRVLRSHLSRLKLRLWERSPQPAKAMAQPACKTTSQAKVMEKAISEKAKQHPLAMPSHPDAHSMSFI